MLALTASTAVACAAAASAAIPSRFVGQWATDRTMCAMGPTESTMRISSDALLFYASGGGVESVVVDSEGQVTVSATFHEDDGSVQPRSVTLRLSGAGSRLHRDDSDATWHRCADSVLTE